jgi:methylenetetrahydrofolate dehydrogenase (NADP+)/methenyltetrahydrofolate cyclohydrolase
MPATIIDGNALATRYRTEIAARVKAIESRTGLFAKPVRLDALLIDSGDNAARQYAENQGKTCNALGITYKLHTFPSDAGYEDIAGRVLLLNTQPDAAAIMVHLPLPVGVDPYKIQRLIAPDKDVEGVNPANIGNVVYGQSSLIPCTALAVLKMDRVDQGPDPRQAGPSSSVPAMLSANPSLSCSCVRKRRSSRATSSRRGWQSLPAPPTF